MFVPRLSSSPNARQQLLELLSYVCIERWVSDKARSAGILRRVDGASKLPVAISVN
jgi:hypothetical protein